MWQDNSCYRKIWCWMVQQVRLGIGEQLKDKLLPFTFYKFKNIHLQYILYKISHSCSLMKSSFLLYVLSWVSSDALPWAHLRERCQRFLFQALTWSRKTFLDVSDSRCRSLLRCRQSELVWLIAALLAAAQSPASSSASDQYPAQTGGACRDAAGH